MDDQHKKWYDVIVIGAGSAGLGNSGVAHTIGLKTLLIERDADRFGGDCTNYGCVPSKALIHIAKQFHGAHQARRFGLEIQGKADMEKVLEYIHSKQKMIRDEEDAEALRKRGQEVLIGHARFTDGQTIEVNGKAYAAKVFILCTGSSPRTIKIPGMSDMTVYTNETLFFDCTKLPEHFIVIGGGPIGVEMGQAFQRLGSQVYLINRGKRLLEKEPEKVSAILENQLQEEGIIIYNESEVVRFEEKYALIASSKEPEIKIPCSAALMAIGRVVNTTDMGLDLAGIELQDDGRIKVDSYLASTNKRVFVVGDAAGSFMFSHGAEKMVRQLWRNLIIPVFKKENGTADLSWVTFTDPQVAHFGHSERELTEQNVSYYRQDQSFQHEDRAIIQEYQYGEASYWMTRDRNVGKRRLLAGSMIAPEAGELIQEMELAKHAGLPIKKITSRVYPYPVATRINQKSLRGVLVGSYSEFMKKLARMAFRLFHR